MEISEAIRALCGAPHLCAFRFPRPLLDVTPRGGVVDHSGPNPRVYTPKLQDYLAIDWQVMKKEDYAKMMAEIVAKQKAQIAGAGGGEGND